MKNEKELKQALLKYLKGIQIVFENCESIFVPIQCIKQLKYKMEDYKGNSDIKHLITNLDCIIENDGSITRNPNFSNNESPIQRINRYNDITYFDFTYKDESQDSNYVHWYSDKDSYCDSQSNVNQSSELLRYNKIHIIVKPYIPKYSINELFQFKSGTLFQDEDKQYFELVQKKNGDKYLNIPMDEKHINMSYIKIN